MTGDGARRGQRRRAMPFPRLLALTLIAASATPVLLLGSLVLRQVDVALERDALDRAGRALESTDVILAEVASELGALSSSYAEWNTFATLLEAGEIDAIREDVLQFLVDRGAVVAARVTTAGATASAGEPAAWAQLDAALRLLPGELPDDGAETIAAGGDIYLVARRAVRGGSGIELGRLTLLRRLDARFVVNLRRLTGFEVAVVNGGGHLSTATHLELMIAAASIPGADAVTARRVGDIVVGERSLGSPDEARAGSILLATRLGALQAAVGSLPGLVAGLVAATIVAAVLLAASVATVLRRRLGVIHDGLAAVADGRVPPEGGAPADDDIARLAAGLGRLVRTLDHRESTLRRGLEAIASVHPEPPYEEIARRLALVLRQTLGVPWLSIVDEAGRTIAEVGTHDEGDEHAEAAMTFEPDGPRVRVPVPGALGWVDGDVAVFEVMALLAGTVLRDASEIGRVAGRADRLDRANRIQREFLRGVSHNLRSPLATIVLAAGDLAEHRDTYVATRGRAIEGQGTRLSRLVDQVLVLSRMDAGSLTVSEDPVALAPLVKRVVREIGLQDRTTITDHGGGAIVFADAGAVELILWVLLDNAARYAPDSPIRVVISRGTFGRAADPGLTMSIEDDGPGIPAAERRSVFSRYVRGSTAHGHAGMGLGLHVARELARAMRGDIDLAQSTGTGAEFRVALPRAEPGVIDPGEPDAAIEPG